MDTIYAGKDTHKVREDHIPTKNDRRALGDMDLRALAVPVLDADVGVVLESYEHGARNAACRIGHGAGEVPVVVLLRAWGIAPQIYWPNRVVWRYAELRADLSA
jgi:hypothetical protein